MYPRVQWDAVNGRPNIAKNLYIYAKNLYNRGDAGGGTAWAIRARRAQQTPNNKEISHLSFGRKLPLPLAGCAMGELQGSNKGRSAGPCRVLSSGPLGLCAIWGVVRGPSCGMRPASRGAPLLLLLP